MNQSPDEFPSEVTGSTTAASPAAAAPAAAASPASPASPTSPASPASPNADKVHEAAREVKDTVKMQVKLQAKEIQAQAAKVTAAATEVTNQAVHKAAEVSAAAAVISHHAMAKAKRAQVRVEARAKLLLARASARANLMTESSYFRNICQSAFERVDLDRSGTVDFKEVYVAVLLLYILLGKIVNGLTPPKIDEVRDLIARLDMDEAEPTSDLQLNCEEFRCLCVILAENIARRALLQAVISFFLVPVVVTYVLKFYFLWYPPRFPWSWAPAGLCATIVSCLVSSILLPPMIDLVQQRSLAEADVAGVLSNRNSKKDD